LYRFPCEWCPARFPNLATLYQHAQKVHPKELKDQESNDPSTPTTGMSLPTRQPVTPSSVPDFENQQVMGLCCLVEETGVDVRERSKAPKKLIGFSCVWFISDASN
jgi:hypothetical protein